MDKHTIDMLASLHPKLREEATQAWTEALNAMPPNVTLVIDQGYRTFAESDALYAQGRTKPGPIVTNAPGGSSFHNYALAMDFHMMTNGKDDWNVGPLWMKVVSIMKVHGWRWGGDFKTILDQPHFEKSFGYTVKQLKALHDDGKFIPGTNYVQI